jgi:hypothetical protein
MAREIQTDIEIAAGAKRVWEVLTDFAGYPQWNPFLLEVNGRVGVGEPIAFRFELPRGVRLWAKARILKVEPERELRWAGHLLVSALFRAEHYFVLLPLGATRTRLHHGERFSGLLLPLAWPILRTRGRPVYEDMNVALKQRVESGP